MKSIFKKLEARHKSAAYQEIKTQDSKIGEQTEPNASAKPPHDTAAPAPTDTTLEEQQPRPKTENEWQDLISHRIEEAMRTGAFDNLRNKGKPIPQEANPFVRPDQRMANDLLKNNGFAPQWITDRTATLHQIESFRDRFRSRAQQIAQSWQATSDPLTRQQLRERWQQQLASWQDEIWTLNKQINTVNLQQPIARLEIFKLILDDELNQVGMGRSL